jgi:HrpA-like RNA helicase
MEISLFEKYFSTKTLKVPGRQYPVQISYYPSRKDADTVEKIRTCIDR